MTKNITIILLISLLLLVLTNYFEIKKEIETLVYKDEPMELLEDIMILPNEDPTIVQIKNSDTLKNQNEEVYQDVENGDYLIIYTDLGIVFRTSEKKIITIFPIIRDSVDSSLEETQDTIDTQ